MTFMTWIRGVGSRDLLVSRDGGKPRDSVVTIRYHFIGMPKESTPSIWRRVIYSGC